MSRRDEPTTSKALEELRYALANGKAVPKEAPQWLKPFNIRRNPAVFQHRNPHEGDSAAHIRTMAAALSKGISVDLDPVTVWWDGKGWCCIDGHHRLAAYRKANKMENDVPVRVFTGTLDEAIAQAALGNTSVKLSTSNNERLRAAWRLVCTTKLPKAQTVSASKVSGSTVASMRRVKLALDKLGVGETACDLSWYEAQTKARGEDMPEREEWDDAKREALAGDWALAMRKVLPPGFEKHDDIMAMALETLSSKLPDRLMETWGARFTDSEAHDLDLLP